MTPQFPKTRTSRGWIWTRPYGEPIFNTPDGSYCWQCCTCQSGFQKGSTSQIINHLKSKHQQFGPRNAKDESNSKTAYTVNSKPTRETTKPRRLSMSASCVSPGTPDSGYFSSDSTDKMALDEDRHALEAMHRCSNDALLPTPEPLADIDPQFQDQHVLAAVSLATKPAPANPDVEGPQNTKQLPASALDYSSYLYLKSQDGPKRRGAAEATSANWHRMRNAERTRAMREGRKDRINHFKEVMIREAKRKQQQRTQVVEQLKQREVAYNRETEDTYSDSGTDSGEEEEEEVEAEFQLLAGYALPQCQCEGGDWCWWCP